MPYSLPFSSFSQVVSVTFGNQSDKVHRHLQTNARKTFPSRLYIAPCETFLDVYETLLYRNNYNQQLQSWSQPYFSRKTNEMLIKYSSSRRQILVQLLQQNIPKRNASQFNTSFRLYVLYLKNVHRRKPIKRQCQSHT